MIDQTARRSVAIILVAATAAVGALNFFLTETYHGWQVLSIMASVVMAIVIIVLSFVAIGFTNIRIGLIATAAIAFLLAVSLYSFPAKVRFEMSRPSLESVLSKIQQDEQMPTSIWVGSYYVRQIETTDRGEVRFWTALHDFGNTGIVYSPDGVPWLNEMLRFELGKNWYFVTVD